MTYDPFERGPLPVGVRSVEATDATRGRTLPVELWYPAADTYRGQDTVDPTRDRYELIPGFPSASQDAVRDAAPGAGRHPLVLFSHGFGSHRRQSTFLCTHFASHGYVVVGFDHIGNTVIDIMQAMLSAQSGENVEPLRGVGEFIVARPLDVTAMLDAVLAGLVPEVTPLIDATRIGIAGHSFGGWTTLTATAREKRIDAALPLAPAGGWQPLTPNPLAETLDLAWGRSVPTLMLVAEYDTLLPLRGMREIFAKIESPKRMLTLRNADHMHFCDRIEEVHELFRMMPPPGWFAEMAKQVRPIGELCPPEQAYAFARGMGLAHFDATLKGNEAAARVLQDATSQLRDRGIDATED
jgi:predicted dienelactone hydrolase